jgi:hypothetical protein
VGATSTTSNATSSGQGGSTGVGGAFSTTGVGGATSTTGAGGDMQAGTFESGTRIKAQTYVGSDGSRAPGGMYDSQLDTPCSYMEAADGSIRCLPTAVVAGVWFKESTCMQPIVYVSAGCSVGAYAYTLANGCDGGRRIYPVNQQFTAATVYVKSGVSCLSTPPPTQSGGGKMYDLFAEMAPASFVEATVVTEP